MAMTLRLDEATSAQLRALSQALGRSQQQLVHEAVREYVTTTSATLEQTRAQWRDTVRRARLARRVPPGKGDTAAVSPLRPPGHDAPHRAPGNVSGLRPPAYPFVSDYALIPSPPGGILSYLDREDRI